MHLNILVTKPEDCLAKIMNFEPKIVFTDEKGDDGNY